MNDMPAPWLWVSGIFFGLGIVVLIAILAALVKLKQSVDEIVPALTKTVERLESATEKLEATVNSAKKTVDHVGTKARNVADGIEAVALISAQRFQMFSTLLTATSTVFKLMQMVKSTKADKVQVDKKALKRDNKDSSRGVEQPGSSSGS
jgi:hypothetical protein